MGVLAKTDYGREYTVKEKSDFAQLILVSDLGTVQVGEFMQARSWPGMLGSTLLELQRAVKRENVNDDRYLNSIFVLQKKKARRKKGQENELLDDQASDASPGHIARMSSCFSESRRYMPSGCHLKSPET